MRPKKHATTKSGDLFRARLDQIINLNHELAQLKASIVTTNRRAPGGQFVLHAKALPGNPYDGHTLRDIIEDTQKAHRDRARLCR